jgi:hypothetical protein
LDCASEDENFLKRIITGDETWVYGYYGGNETAVFTMGWKKFAKTKKAAAGQVERESHVDSFSLTSRVLYIMNSYIRDKQ